MDLEAMISELRRELELLTKAIQSIERLALSNSKTRRGRPPTKTAATGSDEKKHRHAWQGELTEGDS